MMMSFHAEGRVIGRTWGDRDDPGIASAGCERVVDRSPGGARPQDAHKYIERGLEPRGRVRSRRSRAICASGLRRFRD